MGTATLSSPSLSIEPVNLFGVDSHNSLVRLAALESEGSLQAVSMEDQQRREQFGSCGFANYPVGWRNIA